VIESCYGPGLGHGSRVMLVTSQLNDGPRGSWVTKCDPIVSSVTDHYKIFCTPRLRSWGKSLLH